MADELVSVGKVSGIFGVKGWIKVFSYTEVRENILSYSPWTLTKGKESKEVKVVDGRRHGKTIVACLQGLDDRDDAAALNGWDILIRPEQLPKARKGEYYWADLIGLRVKTVAGVDFGVVQQMLETGANDVVVIAGERERLIPFLQEQTIISIDLAASEMIVDWGSRVLMRFDVVTIFPEMVLDSALNGVTGRAIKQGLVGLSVWNPRDYTEDKYKTVDDRPYGGGPGMVMKYQPLKDAVDAAKLSSKAAHVKVVYLSPQGKPITQQLLNESVDLDQLVLVAGRYEGVDERFIEEECQEEWSLGDFVISGGELAALVVIDAVSRLLPGVLGDEDSAKQDSHMQGLLDCPHYTRPEKLVGGDVPSVLLSGNHKNIVRWRLKQSLGRTWQKRPDMLLGKELTVEQLALLEEFKIELKYKKVQ